MLYRRKRETNLLIDISPLIDVVFLLLIFFMVSTQFKDDHGLDLALPGSESRQASAGKNLTIAIDKNRSIKIGDQDVAINALESTINRLLPDYETRMVVLKVDKSVDHGVVVRVMDAAKAAGAEGLTFATTAKTPENQ